MASNGNNDKDDENNLFEDLLENEGEPEKEVTPGQKETTPENQDNQEAEKTPEELAAEKAAEEEKLRKNKDAEEARKRREKEEKDRKAEEQAKADKEKAEADKEEKAKENRKRIGEQLIDCRKKYPEIDFEALDKDENFREFINGRLLGKKTFTELYEDYLKLSKNLSGKSDEEIRENFEKKSISSPGSTKGGGGGGNPDGIYSEAEYDSLVERLPFMSDAEYKAISAKFQKTDEYFQKQSKKRR